MSRGIQEGAAVSDHMVGACCRVGQELEGSEIEMEERAGSREAVLWKVLCQAGS